MRELNSKGMTLIEIVLSLAIFMLLLSAGLELMVGLFPKKDIVAEQLSSQSEARKMVEEFVNEARGASYSSIGAYPLAEASSTEIIFYANPQANSLRYRIRYFLQGRNLMKGMVEPTGNPLDYNLNNEVVIEALHGIVPTTTIFTYYDASFTGSEDPLPQPVEVGKVKVIGIKVTIDKNPLISPTSFTTESKAFIRNLKDN
jgi:type II secretory pathway pseudopilin PulG